MHIVSHQVRAVSISIAASILFITGGLLRAAGPEAWAVPTFESLGLYYNRAMASRRCKVRYRPANATAWREGYPLVYDPRERQYRGSLVGLTPDTLYDIRLEADGAPAESQARTRSEQFPIGKTTFLPGGTADETLTIREGGTEKAWHLFIPAPGTKYVNDVFNRSDYNIVVDADHVILRGLELKNARIHGPSQRAIIWELTRDRNCNAVSQWGQILLPRSCLAKSTCTGCPLELSRWRGGLTLVRAPTSQAH